MNNKKSKKRQTIIRTLESALIELLELLEKENPFIFCWNWIVKRNRNLTRYFKSTVLANGSLKERDIIAFLPEKWQKIFEDTVFCEIIIDLFCFLEKTDPKNFSRVWIIRNNNNLYMRIFQNVRKDGKIYWPRVISALPEKWQVRWDDNGRFIFRELINKMIKFFEETNPAFISKDLIRCNANFLYKQAFRNVRKDGKIDWLRVVEAWPEKWQKRWVGDRCDRDKLPAKWKVTQGSYFSQDEVEVVLSENKEYLYTLVTAITKKEKEIQDVLINSLIRLAQNGNLCAREKLVPFLELKCSDWSLAANLSSCPMAHEDTLKKINACINNYNFEIRFLPYLYVSLKKQLDGLCIPIPLQLDLEIEGGRSYHEVLTTNF